jgi:apolipoprotein N-acyltransferase
VVWPESAMPVILLEENAILARIQQRLGTRTLVTGTLRRDMGGFGPDGAPVITYYNSMVSIDEEGGALHLGGLHDKHHLVPFGEYVPFQDVLALVGLQSLASVVGGITPGAQPGLFRVPKAPPADPRICYEIIFPDFNRTAAMEAGWILNVSVDAWYGDGLGPDQHYALSRWRAIETGLPLVRAASGGWSAVVDPYGRALAEHRTGPGHAVAKLPQRTTAFYASSLPPWSLIVLVLFLLIAGGLPALLSQGLTRRTESVTQSFNAPQAPHRT